LDLAGAAPPPAAIAFAASALVPHHPALRALAGQRVITSVKSLSSSFFNVGIFDYAPPTELLFLSIVCPAVAGF